MSEYTPTTKTVEAFYCHAWQDITVSAPGDHSSHEEFYRWLNSVKADELDELVEEYDRIFANSEIVKMASPEIYWAGTEDAVKHLFQKTRKRIGKYRTGGAE